MAATFLYDSVTKGQAAVDTLAGIQLDEQRIRSRFATVSGTMQPDTSYPTGGYPSSPAKFGLQSVRGVLLNSPPGYVASYNVSTDKVQLFEQGAAAGVLTEVASATNLSAVQVIYFEAKGFA